jgi:hypothetical protein
MLAGSGTRLGVLVVVGALVVALGVTLVVHRSGHQPAGSTARSVPLSVSCPAAGSCAAVDDLGNAVHLEGEAWSRPVHLESANGMSAVSCATPTFCVAVDTGGQYARFNGRTWSKLHSFDVPVAERYNLLLGLSGVTTVSCPTTRFCMAGDVLGKYFTFDGDRWQGPKHVEPVKLLNTDRGAEAAAIVEVSCTGPHFCAAVTARGRALTWNGTRWSSPDTLVSGLAQTLDQVRLLPGLAGVSCSSPTQCVAVSPGGYAYTYDGSAWSPPLSVDTEAARKGSDEGLTAVSCVASSFCMAVDGLGRSLSYDGTSWAPPYIVDSALGLNDVSCASPSFCVALDDLGEAAVFNGTTWKAPRTVDQ